MHANDPIVWRNYMYVVLILSPNSETPSYVKIFVMIFVIFCDASCHHPTSPSLPRHSRWTSNMRRLVSG